MLSIGTTQDFPDHKKSDSKENKKIYVNLTATF